MTMTRRQRLKGRLLCGIRRQWPCAVLAAQDDPFTFVVDLSNRILKEIVSNPALKAGQREQVNQLVNDKMLPAADFAMMTRMTVGPHWRKASEEQKQALMNGFKGLLIRVYSGALTTVKDQVCELRPTRNKKIADEMVIRTVLKSKTEPEIGLDYRIYRNKAGEWKIVDVNVEGIWLVENYRSQFASILSQGGVDGLIRALNDEKRFEKK